MARVIVITSGKGGVGKTTTTSNLGMTLARLGHSTLLIDADVGLRNLDLLLGLENRIIYTGSDVLNETCRLDQALIQDKRQPQLAFFPLSSTQAKTPITQSQIKTLIGLVTDKYDFILIDSPAGIDEGFQTAIVSAHESLVIVTPEVPSIRDADKVIGILATKGIKNNKLIINRIRPKMVKNDDMMSIDDITSILGIPVLGIIPDSEQVIIASNRGEPLVLEDSVSLPGVAFENIARRLLGEDIEVLDMENISSKGLVKRIFSNLLNRKNQNS
tara:strand:+ start:1376 stop:2194 length:819 start_codon:yes stop_codon:yes gene_type:complete